MRQADIVTGAVTTPSPRLKRRPSRKYVVDGEEFTLRELAAHNNLNEHTLRKRVVAALKEGKDIASVLAPANYPERHTPEHDAAVMGKLTTWLRTHHLVPNSKLLCPLGGWQGQSTALAFCHRMVEQGRMARDDDGNFTVPGVWLPAAEVSDLVQLLKGTIVELKDSAARLAPEAEPLQLTIAQQQEGLCQRAEDLAAFATKLQSPAWTTPEFDPIGVFAEMQEHFKPLSYVENLNDRPGPEKETPGDVQ